MEVSLAKNLVSEVLDISVAACHFGAKFCFALLLKC